MKSFIQLGPTVAIIFKHSNTLSNSIDRMNANNPNEITNGNVNSDGEEGKIEAPSESEAKTEHDEDARERDNHHNPCSGVSGYRPRLPTVAPLEQHPQEKVERNGPISLGAYPTKILGCPTSWAY